MSNSLESVLSSPPFDRLAGDVRHYLSSILDAGVESWGGDELSDVLSPYLLDAGIAADDEEAQILCMEFARKAALPVSAQRPLAGHLDKPVTMTSSVDFEIEGALVEPTTVTASDGGRSKRGKNKRDRRALVAAGVAAINDGGASFQFTLDEDVAAAVSITLRAEHRSRGSELSDTDLLATSLIAYAEERKPTLLSDWRTVFSNVLEDADTVIDEDDSAGAVNSVLSALVRKGVLELAELALVPGVQVFAVLNEDEEWHPAVIDEVLADDRFKVVFVEYGKPQIVEKTVLRAMEDVVDEDAGEMKDGQCEMCERHKLLTFHHLVPKHTHSKYLGKRLPAGLDGEPTRHWLNTHGTMICRRCHSMVHSVASNDVLAEQYNTVAKLLAHPTVRGWIEYARKQH